MRIQFIILVLGIVCLGCSASKSKIEDSENLQEFDQLMSDIREQHIYLKERKALIRCIEKTYRPLVDTISQSYYKVLFYENLINEFNDSHMHLTTNTEDSYRLNSPVYVELREGRYYIKNIFSSELQYAPEANVIGAEVVWFNELPFQEVIDAFPTQCHNRKDPVVKEWLANKVVAGVYNEARFLGLRLTNGEEFNLDVDKMNFKQRPGLLEATRQKDIGIIKINNSLGNDSLPYYFDLALEELMDTQALVLDLRNTSSGGNTSVAEPIMGRFISETREYQGVELKEESYVRTISSVGETYTQPLYVLVGRWTGSMGEGMAIGFDGMKRGTVVGTEMYRLAGGMTTIMLKNSNYGARVSIEKLYHLDGRLRETYVPAQYVNQQSVTEDEFLQKALDLIKNN